MAKTKHSAETKFSDIVNSIARVKGNRKVYGKTRTARIINRYIELMEESVLQGFSFDIPKLGTLCIHKNQLKPGQMPSTSPAESIKNKEATLALNPRRMGYYYTIDLESEVLQKHGMTFKAAESMCEKLHIILMTTNQEYRLKR